MKARAVVPLWAGENTVFDADVAETMVGTSRDGYTILEAEQTKPDLIALTVEYEIEPTQFKEVDELSFKISNFEATCTSCEQVWNMMTEEPPGFEHLRLHGASRARVIIDDH